MKPPLEVILCSPRGFCAGVERAVDIVDKALEATRQSVYVRHEIVHNKRVVENLEKKGAVFVDEVSQIPTDALTVFSAHGVSQAVEDEATELGLEVIDATCPLVSKVHIEGQKYAAKGFEVILVGHRHHPEVIGTIGRIKGKVHLVSTPQEVDALTVQNTAKVAYICQTTLCAADTSHIVERIKQRFPKAKGQNLDDICYATHNRQKSARQMAEMVEVYFVIGGNNSSNSKALYKIGCDKGLPSYLLSDADQFDPNSIKNAKTIGITSGASTPDELVKELIQKLGDHRQVKITELKTTEEDINFNLPKKLEKLIKPPA